MTAKELKNALLHEAMQGKLVPQIASEGNARDLLEEIRKERGESLPIASARKRSSATPSAGSNAARNARFAPITEEEILFDIPENWCWCRLGEIVINRDRERIPLSVAEREKLAKTYDYYGASGVIDKVDKYLFDKPLLLIGEDGANLLNRSTPIAFIAKGKYWVNNHAHVLDCDDRYIFMEYVMTYINSISLAKYVTGTAQPKMNQEKMNSIPVPLPPLAEQKRIVAAIEKFMPLIDEYGKKETELKALNEQIGTLTKKAILQEAVQGKIVPQIATEGNAKDLLEEIKKEKAKLIKEGKIKKEKTLPEITEDEIPFDIPESWCWCRLSELCNLYTGDSINETEKKLKYTNIKEGWFYIGTKDVNFDQTINYDNGIKIPFEKENFRIAPKNTVLMCIEGGSAGRKIAFTNQDVCFGNKLCCFNSYKNEIEKFIFYFLQSTLFTDAFKDNINGIIGGVSINNLKGMLFPLPPLAEQKRIVDVIEKMLPLCEKLGV